MSSKFLIFFTLVAAPIMELTKEADSKFEAIANLAGYFLMLLSFVFMPNLLFFVVFNIVALMAEYFSVPSMVFWHMLTFMVWIAFCIWGSHDRKKEMEYPRYGKKIERKSHWEYACELHKESREMLLANIK